ncbi:hypothetical protein [Nostoc sp. CMAA1605]|uniref:hypothetical protein n=1 Tax=Nostoc sp. CMAA1605 TaxID=2055159 RepID=UPI001F22060A|nr:hypothetical protein [Nostoc sp. CMAA1605]MCF4970397.1 hypothetical protein [Nostoc sp. CMAA1605]
MTSEIQELSDARKKLTAAYRAVYAIGFLNVFVSILIFLLGSRLPDYLLVATISLIAGVLYLALGFFVQRKSKIALGIAIGFMVLNVIGNIPVIMQTGNIFILTIPMIFFSQTVGGFNAIQVLNSKLAD